MEDYSTLHWDIHSSKGTACCKKGYGFNWTWDFKSTFRHTFK